MPMTRTVRRKLKGLAQNTAAEICQLRKPERPEAKGYFYNELDKSVEKREAEERELEDQIQRLLDDGCPHAND